ncbi:MAG: hypothetical protein AAF416_14345 [Pseudomonadota bacterium]
MTVQIIRNGVLVDEPDGYLDSTGTAGLSLDEVRRLRKIEASVEFRRRMEMKANFGGVGIRTDTAARSEIEQLVGFLTRSGGTLSFVTRTEDGVPGVLVEDMTLIGATQLRQVVESYAPLCIAREAALFKAIDQAGTIAAVEAIDVTTGWPEGV